MRKRKLKMWVKVVLVIIIIVGCFKCYANFCEKEINACVETGHNEEYCKGVM